MPGPISNSVAGFSHEWNTLCPTLEPIYWALMMPTLFCKLNRVKRNLKNRKHQSTLKKTTMLSVAMTTTLMITSSCQSPCQFSPDFFLLYFIPRVGNLYFDFHFAMWAAEFQRAQMFRDSVSYFENKPLILVSSGRGFWRPVSIVLLCWSRIRVASNNSKTVVFWSHLS